MSTAAPYWLTVNGDRHEVGDALIGESLLFVLRERLGLPGSKNACEQGECGSCSVLVDGALVCSCLMLAAAVGASGGEVVTIEGIGATGGIGGSGGTGGTGGSGGTGGTGGSGGSGGSQAALTDVQQAFLDAGAVQCGFCTPGLVVAVHDLLERVPDPTDLDIREAISGNLCRCTGYGRIFEAIRAAAATRRSGS